jgi:ADP-ribose pyrophosphatase YjhB (NUDIX family)
VNDEAADRASGDRDGGASDPDGSGDEDTEGGIVRDDPETEIRTWQADGIHRRERVQFLDSEAFADARERVDSGLEWGVGGLVEHEGQVLLVRQDDRWLLPGGEVEDGETHAEALVRELDEETGVAVRPGERLAVVENVLRHDGRERSFRFAIYRATPEHTDTAEDPGLADEAIQAVRWVDSLPPDALDRDLLVELLGADWA